MKRLLASIVCALFVWFPASAQAEFGVKDIDLSIAGQEGSPALLAGSHPFALTTSFGFNTVEDPKLGTVPDDAAKDILIKLPPGMVADPTAVPRCPAVTFIESVFEGAPCPNDSALGTITVEVPEPGKFVSAAVYNVTPPAGGLMKFGFIVLGVPVTIDVGLNSKPPYNGVVSVTNVSQVLRFYSSKTTIWGVPSNSAHDAERGSCFGQAGQLCPVDGPERPFLTLPGNCESSMAALFQASSWQNPGVFDEPPPAFLHGEGEAPNPPSDCASLIFSPSISIEPTSHGAASSTGLEFSLSVNDEGIQSPAGRAQSEVKKAVVTLPEGFTTNPAVANGLEGCSEPDLARETATSEPGAGCPNASKIGTLKVESPLLDEALSGSVYAAMPYENPFGSLLGLYMVIRNPNLGLLVTQPLKVETDPVTGRITSTAEDLPQLPFSHFTLNLRQGARSPLATPAGCGSYGAEAVLTPWSGGPPVRTNSVFEINTGSGGGACPSGLPFSPSSVAGTVNNAAAHYSPFNLQLSRSDGEQEFNSFSVDLPRGLVAKLAGVSTCSDGAIAAARARTGPYGGQEELSSPSCPASSQIGRTLVGAGVGPALTYAPGKLYLAGPYNGNPLSVVAITAAKVGPFDLGTVVVRESLKVDPVTADVSIDAAGSDPLPHIIKGIPVHLRDIRVYTDRPEFVLNPTGCKRTAVKVNAVGSGGDLGSAADDVPVTVSTPFQAADCAALGFKPKLALKLTGGTKRGSHPALRAELRTRSKNANPSSISVRLPHSEFLDQGHIRTICTRVQFAAGAGHGSQCPKGAVYGRARAWSPLLDAPLEGPVILRSSNNPLPDLVLALHGLIDIEAAGRISSINGGISNSFDFIPDAPISKVVVNFQGGKKGLLVNSTDICRGTHRARVQFSAHNGRSYLLKPQLKAKCGKKSQSK